MHYIIIIIIISDSVDDRDQKPRYGIEVLLNLSRYQPALGNERINTKWINTKWININKYFTILYCSFVFCLIKKQYNKIKYISQYQEIIMYITIK